MANSKPVASIHSLIGDFSLPQSRSAKPPRPCACGCGGWTRGGRFIPGHDAKLLGVVKRIEAGVFVRGGDLADQLVFVYEQAGEGVAAAAAAKGGWVKVLAKALKAKARKGAVAEPVETETETATETE